MKPRVFLAFVCGSQYMINVIVIVALRRPKNVVNTPNTYAKCHMPIAMYCIPNIKSIKAQESGLKLNRKFDCQQLNKSIIRSVVRAMCVPRRQLMFEHGACCQFICVRFVAYTHTQPERM